MHGLNTDRLRRVVYVTYDGLEDPLGQSQVLPYLEGLASRGHEIDVLSFEKRGVARRWRERKRDGLKWSALRYHKRPSAAATAFDIVQGAAAAGAIGLLSRADLVHVRSYVAATLALPWVLGSRTPLLFDTRGMWPDEKIDAGAWGAGGRLYRSAKRVERVLLRRADLITVLTHAMQAYLRDEYPYRGEIRAAIHVIPTCTDLERFSPDVAPEPALATRLQGARVLAYAGSLGTWYLDAEMARFYLAWRAAVRSANAAQPTRFLLVSHGDPAPIGRLLGEAGAGAELVHHPARYADVPAALRCAEAALCFVRRTLSRRGTAPTKLGEALACGLPVVANIVGDMKEIVGGPGSSDVGVIVDDMSDARLAAAAASLLAIVSRGDIAASARRVAEQWFSLHAGIDAYDRLYRAVPVQHLRTWELRDARWPVQ